MTSAIYGQRIGHVDRPRASQHGQVRIIAERFVAGDDHRRISLIDAGQRRPRDAERRELIRALALRIVIAVERVHPDAQLVVHPRRHGFCQGRGEIVPLIEHRRAETRQVARADGKRVVPIVAAEAVAEHQRAAVPDDVIRLDRELSRLPVGERRRNEVSHRIASVGHRIEVGRRQARRADPISRYRIAGERQPRERDP